MVRMDQRTFIQRRMWWGLKSLHEPFSQLGPEDWDRFYLTIWSSEFTGQLCFVNMLFRHHLLFHLPAFSLYRSVPELVQEPPNWFSWEQDTVVPCVIGHCWLQRYMVCCSFRFRTSTLWCARALQMCPGTPRRPLARLPFPGDSAGDSI